MAARKNPAPRAIKTSKPKAKKPSAAKPSVSRTAAKSVAKKPVAKKPVAKKKVASTKKPTAAKPVKKPAVKRASAKPAAAKTATKRSAKRAIPKAEKKPAEKTSGTRSAKTSLSKVAASHSDVAVGIAARKAAAKAKSTARMAPVHAKSVKSDLKKLSKAKSAQYESSLLRIRDELSRQIAFLRGTSLTRADEVNAEEDGSDAFERQLALKLAANENDAVFEIDEALQRIRDGVYAVCEDCSCIIGSARLKALPFARQCVECKARAEKNGSSPPRRFL